MNQQQSAKLNKLIAEIDDLIRKRVTSSSPEFKAWKTSVQRLLIQVFGEKSFEVEEFRKTSFSLSVYTFGTPESDFANACKRGLEQSRAVLATYLDDEAIEQPAEASVVVHSNRVFIVHGHDGGLREAVARLLDKQGIEPIILMEQPNRGRTIIEKFEDYSDVGTAICLFTADDNVDGVGGTKQVRARQNVVLETGFFIGKLGRERVIILSNNDIEMPSDLSGVLYTSNGNWKFEVLKELKTMGYSIDLNKIFS